MRRKRHPYKLGEIVRISNRPVDLIDKKVAGKIGVVISYWSVPNTYILNIDGKKTVVMAESIINSMEYLDTAALLC